MGLLWRSFVPGVYLLFTKEALHLFRFPSLNTLFSSMATFPPKGIKSQGRQKHQGIGPANTPKQLINYSYFVLRMRRHTPEHMTINKQRQESINKHLRKTRQRYSTHPRAASCSLTRSMHAARKGTKCCAESALAGSLIMEIHNLGLNIGPAAAVPVVPVPAPMNL